MASNSPEELRSIQRVKTLVEKRLKSLTKQKKKLEHFKAEQDACKGLSSDQAAAVIHYDCVVRCMEIANDLSKQFIDILQEYSKETEKIRKQEQQELLKKQQKKHVDKVKDILKIQNVLQQLGSEQVRRDFLAGAKGAILLYHQQLGQIHNLFRMVTPTTKERISDDQNQKENLDSATSHLLSLVDEKDAEVAGSTYKQLYSLIKKIYDCPYRRKGPAPAKDNNITSELDTSMESSSSTIENAVESLPKDIQASLAIQTKLKNNISAENRPSTPSSIGKSNKSDDTSWESKHETKGIRKDELRNEDELVGVNQLRQQLMDTEERLRDMERTHGTMSAKLSELTQAQAKPTEKLKQHNVNLSSQCQKCNENFKVLEEKAADEVQLRLHLSEIDAVREKAVNDLAGIMKERDSLTVTIDTQAKDIALAQTQLQEMLNKKIALETRLTTLETELIKVRQELSNQITKKETPDVFHRILIVGDERIPQLSYCKPDTLQIYSKPGLKLDNVLSFIKGCNICPVTDVDTLVIVSVGINDIVEMAPVENCRTMNHDPLMVCPNYNAFVASAKIITDKIYSVYTDLKDYIRGTVHFTPVLPVNLIHYQEELLKEHKDKTGHSVVVYNSIANRHLVNTKVNDIISEVNTHVQLFIGEGRHDWEIYNNTEGMQTSQFLSNGFSPSSDALNIMVNKLKTIQKKHAYNEKMDINIRKLVMNSVERKKGRKEFTNDWGLKEENSFTFDKSERSSNYSRTKNYSKRQRGQHSRNDDEWHSPGRCVSPDDWHHPEVCRKKEFRRTGVYPQTSRDGRKFINYSDSPDRFKESRRSPNRRSRERSRSPCERRSRSWSRDRVNQKRWSRSPDRRRRPQSRGGSSRRSNSPRSSRSRSKSPEDSQEMDPSKLKAFKYVFDELEQDYKGYMANPSSHPEYNNEYFKFYESKSRTISNIGGDVSKYDFSIDWQELWPRRMKDLYKQSKYELEKKFTSGLTSKEKRCFKRHIRDYNSLSSYSDESPRKKALQEKTCFTGDTNFKLPFELVNEDKELVQEEGKGGYNETSNEEMNLQEVGEELIYNDNEEINLQEVGDDTTIPFLLNHENSKINLNKDEDDKPLYPLIPQQIGKLKHNSLSSDNGQSRSESPQAPPPPIISGAGCSDLGKSRPESQCSDHSESSSESSQAPPPPIISHPTVEEIFVLLKAKPVSEQLEMFTNFSTLDNTHQEALNMLLEDIESHDADLALSITALMD